MDEENFGTNTIEIISIEKIEINSHRYDIEVEKNSNFFAESILVHNSSCTIFRWEGELRVCSRNLELKINEENKDNTFVAMALKYGDVISEGYAVQGELWGEAIQGNKENIKGHYFSVYDIFDIKKHEYVSPAQRRVLCEKLGLNHVPILFEEIEAPDSIEEALKIASGPSIKAKQREGVVYKCIQDPSFSFKVISNDWLLKNGE